MERADYANVPGRLHARPKWRVIIRGIMVIKTLNPYPRLAVSLARLLWEYPESRQKWVDPSSTVISATPWLHIYLCIAKHVTAKLSIISHESWCSLCMDMDNVCFLPFCAVTIDTDLDRIWCHGPTQSHSSSAPLTRWPRPGHSMHILGTARRGPGRH